MSNCTNCTGNVHNGQCYGCILGSNHAYKLSDEFHKAYNEMWDKFIHPFNKRLTENGGL